MKQLGFFDESIALDRLSKLGDKLEWLNEVMDWNIFEKTLEAAKPDKSGTSLGGRPPYPLLLMFKITILQHLYNVSDESMEFQINDRLSWKRFLGLSLSEKVPDSTTIRDFREILTKTRCYDSLFHLFTDKLREIGVVTNKGSIVDASFKEVPRQRITKEQKAILEDGEIPEEWAANPHKMAQRDTSAAWTKKGNQSFFGYKNHIKADRDSKIITQAIVTPANVHDSQAITHLVDESDNELWGDSAYIGEDIEKAVREIKPEIKLHINEKGFRNRPLTDEQKVNNREKSRVRARVEHIFGHMENAMGGAGLRCIGEYRAMAVVMLKNLAYNISRFATLCKPKKEAKSVA